jgi:hypothetical protein
MVTIDLRQVLQANICINTYQSPMAKRAALRYLRANGLMRTAQQLDGWHRKQP